MTTLEQLQNAFQNYLTVSDPKKILPTIKDTPGFTAENRLKVYHDAYRLRLMEILKLDFPKTYQLLGEENFETAFITYLSQHPSTHFSVRYFGASFSHFLKQTAPYKNHVLFSEMAQFEWLVAYTLDAKDAPVLTTKMLSQLPPEQWAHQRFSLHPSVVSAYFTLDTPQIWQALENEAPPRLPIQLPTPVRWIFWRTGTRSYFQSCKHYESVLLDNLASQKTFSSICEALLDLLPEESIPQVVAQTLYKWVDATMIAAH